MNVNKGWGRPSTVPRKETLPTAPAPYSWLFLQGLAWYLKPHVFAMLAEREVTEKKMEKYQTSQFSQQLSGMVQLPWTGKMRLLDSTQMTWFPPLLCPPPIPTPLPKPATTPRLSSGMTSPSIFNLPTKAETWAVAKTSPPTSPSHPIKSCWFYLKRAFKFEVLQVGVLSIPTAFIQASFTSCLNYANGPLTGCPASGSPLLHNPHSIP